MCDDEILGSCGFYTLSNCPFGFEDCDDCEGLFDDDYNDYYDEY